MFKIHYLLAAMESTSAVHRVSSMCIALYDSAIKFKGTPHLAPGGTSKLRKKSKFPKFEVSFL